MKFFKLMPARKLVAIGLLLIVVPTLARDFVPVPHFISGFLAGVGLGIEIMGLIKLKKEKDGAKRDMVKDEI